MHDRPDAREIVVAVRAYVRRCWVEGVADSRAPYMARVVESALGLIERDLGDRPEGMHEAEVFAIRDAIRNGANPLQFVDILTREVLNKLTVVDPTYPSRVYSDPNRRNSP